MSIHKENIDQYIFDYFEGNLTETDKKELLGFIHKNQQYEKDFIQWSQSYAHIGEPVKNYGIRDLLLKNSAKPVFTLNQYFISIVVASIAGLLVWWAFYTPEQNVNPFTKQIQRIGKTQLNNQIGPASPIKQSELRPVSTLNKSKSLNKVNVNKSVESNDTLFTTTDTHISKKIIEDKTKKADSILVQQDAIKVSVNNPDSVIATTPSQKRTHSKTPAKKKKKRNILNLNTDPDFLEQNPDF